MTIFILTLILAVNIVMMIFAAGIFTVLNNLVKELHKQGQELADMVEQQDGQTH